MAGPKRAPSHGQQRSERIARGKGPTLSSPPNSTLECLPKLRVSAAADRQDPDRPRRMPAVERRRRGTQPNLVNVVKRCEQAATTADVSAAKTFQQARIIVASALRGDGVLAELGEAALKVLGPGPSRV